MTIDTRPQKRGGFASISDPQRRKEIARLGGLRVHELGLGHQWTKEEAAAASKIALEHRRAKMLKNHTTEK